MSSLKKISIVDIESISLKDILEKCENGVWQDGEVAKSRYSVDVGNGINKSIRNVDVLSISEDLYPTIHNVIEPHVTQYAKENGIDIESSTGYSLTRYSVGQFFQEHVDSTKEFPRKISIVLYLNDDYEGGTITFTKINKSFKPKANSLFIFPSDEEFSHSADPVISGTKYIIVGFWS